MKVHKIQLIVAIAILNIASYSNLYSQSFKELYEKQRQLLLNIGQRGCLLGSSIKKPLLVSFILKKRSDTELYMLSILLILPIKAKENILS